MERAPVSDGGIPLCPRRCHRAAFEIGESHVIGCDQPGARARLDAHVAHGQPLLDAHAFEHRPAIFDHIAAAACRTDLADDVHNQVFGGHAGAKIAVYAHLHRFRLLQQQRLRCQHVFNLAGADPEGERAQTAVAGGMRIAADNGGAGQRESLFGADHMDDTLFLRCRRDVADAEFGCVAFKRGELRGAFRVGNRQHHAIRITARRGGQIVIGHRERQFGPPHRPSGYPQPLKRLRTGHFVHQMPVNIDQRGAIIAGFNHVRVPDFFV